MAICVAGMHRAGTSLVTRLLNLCGVYLGEARDLVPPGPDNPEGFWENLNFVVVNDMLLEVLGGAWDDPPALPAGWERRPELEPYRLAGLEVVDAFGERTDWGWKDPRNSLTLPFWRHLVPALRLLVCVRHPVEVARSLAARDRMSIAAGLDLWLTYYSQLLADASPTGAVVTHYASYLENPDAELRRVLRLLELPASERMIRTALPAVGRGLRHHDLASSALRDCDTRPELVALYEQLCDAATAPAAAHLRAPTPRVAPPRAAW